MLSESQDPAKDQILTERQTFLALLRLMHIVGTQFSGAPSATRRAWGKHLLEDWRSLDLIADKVGE